MLKCLLLFCLSIAGCATRSDIPNRREVTAHIIRGGQPTRAGWEQLKRAGVTVVVKLNTGRDADAEALGLRVIYLPITTAEQTIGKPKPSTVNRAVWLIELVSRSREVVYVHCTHGEDRTGLVIGAYRGRTGWSKQQAYAEMKTCGFHPLLRGLYWFWEEDVPENNFARRSQSQRSRSGPLPSPPSRSSRDTERPAT